MKKLKIDKNYFYIFIITLVIMIPFISNRYIMGHDTLYHLANIDAITSDWLNFNFSKISGTLIDSLGYGGSIFYPKLPHYLAAFINIPFHLIGKGPTYSIVIVETVMMFLAGIFMYELVKKIYKNEKAGIIGTVFYIASSYMITDVFIRNAYNEACMFTFLPIIFLALEHLKENNENKFILLFSIGYIGMVNTHLVLAVYFTFFVILYILLNFKKYIKKESLISFVKASAIIIIICMPQLVLMIQHKNLDIYGVFRDNVMVTLDSLKAFSIRLKDFIIPDYKKTNPSFLNYFFNIIEVIGILLSTLYIFIGKDKKIKKNVIIYGIVFAIAIFMSTKFFPYELFPKLLLSIQFAYRCALFVCFFGAIYATYCVQFFSESTKGLILRVAIIVSLLAVVPIINSANYSSTGGIIWDKYSGLGYQREYLTVNALESKKYETKRNKIEVLNESDLSINIIENKTPKLIAKIDNVTKKTTIELPRLYYLGYDIKYVNKKGVEYKLDYELDKAGFIKIDITESGTLYVKYTGTLLYNIFRIIRLISIIIVVILIVIRKKGLKK